MDTPQENIEWLTQQQVAEVLGCSKRTIRNYIAEGTLPAYRFGLKLVRIKRSDVDGMFVRIPKGDV